MKILNDQEHRIFLAAMSRERKVCGREDFSIMTAQTNCLTSVIESNEK